MPAFRRAWGRAMYFAAVSLRGERSVYGRMAELERLQFRTADEIAERQRELLVHVLRDKLPHVRHYARWRDLAAGATVHDAEERLRGLPIIEKELLQKDGNSLRVERWNGRSHKKTTGGSTGRPVTVEKNPEAIAQEMAASWLGYGWFGLRIGDPCVRFWGQPARNLRRRLRYLAADAATNRITLSAFGYSPSTLDRYLCRIERFRPAFLYGYVSALEDLARHIAGRWDPSLEGLGIKAVVTTSEALSAPQRALMESAFGAPVQNEYGCGEVGPIAYECEAGALHLMPFNHYVEVLDADGAPAPNGEPGSVIITDLTNDVMPLTRYRVGDTAARGRACSCGRGFPVLDYIFGREYDYVENPAGQRFHGEFFMYLFEDLRKKSPGIGQFKVVQLDHDHLEVQLVVSGDAGAVEAAVSSEFGRRLPEFGVAVKFVPAIPRQPSGKMRVVENRLASQR
ncbi:MAG: hypothetical protein P8099_19915 [Gemmatimonadota bacterium]